MTTTTSFYKLYKRELLGNLYNMLLLLFIGVLFFTVPVFIEYRSMAFNEEYGWSTPYFIANSNFYSELGLLAIAVFLIGAFVVALISVKYIHNKRAVDLYHSLPVKREVLTLSAMFAVVKTVMIPATLTYIITYIVHYAFHVMRDYDRFYVELDYLLLEWVALLVAVVVITAIVFFVAQFVGTIVETLIYSLEFMFAPVAIYLLTPVVLQIFLKGYVLDIQDFAATILTPVVSPFVFPFTTFTELEAWIMFLSWILLALALTFGAMFFNKIRKSELAEVNGNNCFMRNIMVVLASTVGSFALGLAFMSIFGIYSSTYAFPWVEILSWDLIIVAIAVLILNRGFAGAKKFLPLATIAFAVPLILGAMIDFDIFGYVKRVPSAESAESVTIQLDYTNNWYGYVWDGNRHGVSFTDEQMENPVEIGVATITDKETIQLVTELHRAYIDYDTEGHIYSNTNSTDVNVEYSNFYLQYNLGFSNMKRAYSKRDVSTNELYSAILNSPEVVASMNPTQIIPVESVKTMVLYDNLGFEVSDTISTADAQQLYSALQQDSLAMGMDYKESDRLLGYLYIDMESLLFNYSSNFFSQNSYTRLRAIDTMNLPIFEGYEKTAALLEQMGYELSPEKDWESVDAVAISNEFWSRGYYISTLDSDYSFALDESEVEYFEYSDVEVKIVGEDISIEELEAMQSRWISTDLVEDVPLVIMPMRGDDIVVEDGIIVSGDNYDIGITLLVS